MKLTEALGTLQSYKVSIRDTVQRRRILTLLRGPSRSCGLEVVESVGGELEIGHARRLLVLYSLCNIVSRPQVISIKFSRFFSLLLSSSLSWIAIITPFPCYHVYSVFLYKVAGYNVCCISNINTLLFYTNNLVHTLGTTIEFSEEMRKLR